MRRTIPNLLEELDVIEAVHPDGFEDTPNAARWGADLLGRAIGHESHGPGSLDVVSVAHEIFTAGLFTASQRLMVIDACLEVSDAR